MAALAFATATVLHQRARRAAVPGA
jgi:hypothetical protein